VSSEIISHFNSTDYYTWSLEALSLEMLVFYRINRIKMDRVKLIRYFKIIKRIAERQKLKIR